MASLVLGLAMAASAAVWAASTVPAAVNYQGRLTDNYGSPVTGGYYEVQFKVWDDPTQTGAGNYIWGRSFPLHVVTNGLFNVLLTDDGGLVSTPGTPKATNLLAAFEGPDRYLGLTITKGPSGNISSPVEISPRQKLASAPFAIHAWNAANAASLVNSTNAQVVSVLGTNVGINKTTPGTALDVGGTVTATSFSGNGSSLTSLNANNLSSGTVADTRLSANVAKLNANQTFTGNNVFNAKVGIGASSPANLLHLAGSADDEWLRIDAAGGARVQLVSRNPAAGPSYVGTIDTNNFGIVTANAQRITVLTNGNVGIGTTSPGKKLTVAGDMEIGTSVVDYRHLRIGGGNVSGYLYGSFLKWGDGVHLGYNYYADANGADHFDTTGAGTSRLTVGYGQIVLATGGNGTAPATRVFVNSSGQVGIGTTYQETPLHVNGSSTAQVTFQENTTSYRWKLGTGNDGHFYFGVVSGPTGHTWSYGAIRYDTGNYVSGSDRRLKKDIESLGGVLDRVLRLRPVSFRFNATPEAQPKSLGFIAQDVEPLFPEVVSDMNGYKFLSMSELVPVAIGAIQELNQKLEQKNEELAEKTARLEALEQDVTELKALVNALTAKVNGDPR